jgi:hypothetical protein
MISINFPFFGRAANVSEKCGGGAEIAPESPSMQPGICAPAAMST